MKVSVITATWNSQDTIGETISSLKGQSYNDIEHIIIDGLSSDRTLEIVGSEPLMDTKIISEQDNGIYHALNKGIDLASGDVIGFLHSDDVLGGPDTITNIVALLNSPNCNAVYGDLEYVYRSSLDRTFRYWKSCEFEPRLLRVGWMPPHPTFFMEKSLYVDLGKFDDNFKISGDYDSMLRYFLSGKLYPAYLPQVICKMRLGGASNKSVSNIAIKMYEDFSIMKRHGLSPIYGLAAKNFSKIKQFFT